MNALDERIIAAVLRVSDLADEYDADLTPIAEAVTVRANLASSILKFQAAKALNLSSTKPVTSNKDFIRTLMVLCVFKFVERGAVMASITPNCKELEKALDVPITSITTFDDANIGTRCMELYNIMKNASAVLTNIKPADFTQMLGTITDYNDILASPKKAIEKRKALGTDAIHGFVLECQGHMKNIVKIFHSYLPDAAHLADVAATIGKPLNKRHISIACKYSDSDTGVLLKGVKTTVTNGIDTFVKYSTVRGWSRFFSLISDSWTITSEHETFQSDTQTKVGVDQTHVARFFIKLIKNDPENGGDPEVTTGSLSLLVYIKSSLEPAAGAQNSIPANNYVNTTDEDGEDYIDSLKPGTLQGVVYLDGYNPVPYITEIKAGETVVIKIYLEPASAPDNPTPDS